MLRKLRITFVCINMLIALFMLCIIFGLILHTTRHNLIKDSNLRLEYVITQPDVFDTDEEAPLRFTSCFVVEQSAAGEVDAVRGLDSLCENDGYIAELLAAVSASGENRGMLERYSLRFLQRSVGSVTYTAFSDAAAERATMRHLMRSCLLSGIISMVVFFFVFLVLTRASVKPVEKAWEQQKQFIADASHELKTPLTVIMTDAELLSAPDCSPADREKFTGSIRTMSEQMRGLVERLLEMARVDHALENSRMISVDLSDVTANALLPFEALFFEAGLTLSSDIVPALRVRGDPARLKELVEILLDNACKYASPGGITAVTLSRSSRRRCRLTVANQGEPIAEEDLRNIFRRFYRADKARSMDHSYGLGLSIAQQIAEEHRAKLTADSRDGWNSFTLEIAALH